VREVKPSSVDPGVLARTALEAIAWASGRA
jgi:hypothetical protein